MPREKNNGLIDQETKGKASPVLSQLRASGDFPHASRRRLDRLFISNSTLKDRESVLVWPHPQKDRHASPEGIAIDKHSIRDNPSSPPMRSHTRLRRSTTHGPQAPVAYLSDE
jgi:hypothetical protein